MVLWRRSLGRSWGREAAQSRMMCCAGSGLNSLVGFGGGIRAGTSASSSAEYGVGEFGHRLALSSNWKR